MNNHDLEYDTIIIGAGLSGGLPAGAYLQKAGARVLMVDANNEAGTHVKVHEYFGGAKCVPCAGGFVGGASPYWADLELEKYGAEMLLNPRYFSLLFPDNTSLAIGPADPEGSVANIARFSPKDSETFAGILTRAKEKMVEMNEQVYFTPPTAESVDKALEIGAYIAGMPKDEFSLLNGFEFLDVLFESDKVKQFLFIPIISSWVTGSPTARGSGPVEMMAAACGGFGMIKGSNHMLVHAFLRVYKKYGGTLWKNSKVSEIVTENGKAVGIRLAEDSVMHPGKIIRAKHAVISNVGAKPTLSLLGEDVVKKADASLYMKMKHWDMATRPSSVTVWVLKEPPKWLAGETDGYINGSDWTFKGYSSMDEWKAWVMNQGAGDIDKAFGGWWEFFIPAHIDPTQAGPEGHVTMRIEEVLPYYLRDKDGKVDPLRWETEKWKLVKQREDMIEEWAPGFKESIVDVVASSPVDLWRSNMTAVNGCSQGGPVIEEQQALNRMPYRMPINNLYMSNSVYPASLSWGATGYNVACMVAEDMGIRGQSWWTARPGEWFLENLPRLVARTEKLKAQTRA